MTAPSPSARLAYLLAQAWDLPAPEVTPPVASCRDPGCGAALPFGTPRCPACGTRRRLCACTLGGTQQPFGRCSECGGTGEASR